MATLLKTIRKTLTAEEWKSLRYTFHRGCREEAFSLPIAYEAAAKRAKASGRTHWIYVTNSGHQIISGEIAPSLPPGMRYYRITVEGDTVVGELFEV